MIFKAITSVTVCLALVAAISAQKIQLSQTRFFTAANKCEALLDAEKWKSAEAFCRNATAIQLPPQYKSEQMRAWENYAFALFSQEKFQPALTSYTKAFEIGKVYLPEDSRDLGWAYFNLGRANQGMASINGKYIVAAESNYLMAETIYRKNYASATDAATKDKAKASIRRTLILLKFMATAQRDVDKYRAIEARITELDR